MSMSGGYGAERRYSVPSNPFIHDPRGMQSEDLHAWSIYRYNHIRLHNFKNMSSIHLTIMLQTKSKFRFY